MKSTRELDEKEEEQKRIRKEKEEEERKKKEEEDKMSEKEKKIKEKKEREDKLKKIVAINGFKYIRNIGEGAYGAVIEVEKNKKIFAVKIILYNEKKRRLQPEEVREFRGKNIVKIIQEKKPEKNSESNTYDEKDYHLYAMECSFIGSLFDFHKFIDNKLIFQQPFVEQFGDNLTRFFVIQMVNALKTLYIGNYVHFDIKPDNMLIRRGLELKLIDFTFLKKLIPEKKDKIPGGTPGYISPEYHQNNYFDNETLQKQDYFAIGMTIFFLKYSYGSLDDFDINNKSNDEKLKITIDSIKMAIHKIQTEKFQDKDFTDFLCSLIQYKPEDRLNFERIVRNKWLNKNTKEIEKINDINESDEDNLVLELQKSDFLIKKRKYEQKNFDKKNNNENCNKNYKQFRKGKFKFGKRN